MDKHTQTHAAGLGFQCFRGVSFGAADVAGHTSMLLAMHPNVATMRECAKRCDMASGIARHNGNSASADNGTNTCHVFSYGRDKRCVLRSLTSTRLGPILDSGAVAGCVRLNSPGGIASPPNYACYSGQDVSGTDLAYLHNISDAGACALRCEGVNGCRLAV